MEKPLHKYKAKFLMGCMLNSRGYFCIQWLPLRNQSVYTPGAEFQQYGNLFHLRQIDNQFHHYTVFHIDAIQGSKTLERHYVD